VPESMAARTAVPSTTVPLISMPSMSTAQKPSDWTGSQLLRATKKGASAPAREDGKDEGKELQARGTHISPVYLLESTQPIHICAPGRLPSPSVVTSDARTR